MKFKIYLVLLSVGCAMITVIDNPFASTIQVIFTIAIFLVGAFLIKHSFVSILKLYKSRQLSKRVEKTIAYMLREE